jgi:hypothetical protein
MRLAFLSLLCAFLAAGTSSACIGLVAGKVQFNVTVGSSETLPIYIHNACQNQSISYDAGVKLVPLVNQSTPRVTISPANGTLGPGAYASLNITVYMPYNATPGTVWHGGAVATEVTNESAYGATVQVGVVKEFAVTAVAAPPDYRLYAAAAIAIAIGAAGGAVYYSIASKRSRKPARKTRRRRR